MPRTLKHLLILMLSVTTVFSCSSSDDGSSGNSAILGTWRVLEVTISEQTLTQRTPNDETLTITFENDGTFSGSTSANTFSGRYQVNNMTLTMLEFTTTEAADTTFGGAFYGAIEAAIAPNTTEALFGFSFDGQNLILIFGDQGQMVLEAQ